MCGVTGGEKIYHWFSEQILFITSHSMRSTFGARLLCIGNVKLKIFRQNERSMWAMAKFGVIMKLVVQYLRTEKAEIQFVARISCQYITQHQTSVA